jgi:alanine dehydrogenase
VRIGVPKEIKSGETRVAVTPEGVRVLAQSGHVVLVESGAGLLAGIDDEQFSAAGATMLPGAADVFASAEMIVKVKEPLPPEYSRLQPGQVLFAYLHLAASRELTDALLASGAVCIGYETVQRADGSLPLLTPMSEVAGRLAAQAGASCLERSHGGRGVLLSGVPGVPPAEVVIVGCGVVGFNAAKVAVGMGAHVTILDVNHDRLRYLDEIMHGNVITVYSNRYTLARAAAYADLLIGAVLVPGARAPKLVSRQMVRRMKRGAVIVDVAVDQGGCVETIHPTSHSEPTYLLYGVLHYGVPNIPAAVPRTSTHALTNATLPYALALADKGFERALAEDTALRRGVNLVAGRVAHPAVAEAFRLPLDGGRT